MQFDFFSKEEQILLDHDGQIIYYSNFFEDATFDQLNDEIKWSEAKIVLYGKEHLIPRLQAWYGDEGKKYSYSGLLMEPLSWTPCLLEVKKQIETFTGGSFNSCLCNLYRDGSDYVSWHSDDEKELGLNPVIASASFGNERKIVFKHKTNKGIEKLEKILEDRSLLMMKGELQHNWNHQITKTAKPIGQRINLTFRTIK